MRSIVKSSEKSTQNSNKSMRSQIAPTRTSMSSIRMPVVSPGPLLLIPRCTKASRRDSPEDMWAVLVAVFVKRPDAFLSSSEDTKPLSLRSSAAFLSKSNWIYNAK